jgi:prephenate dehydrogenase (NADP+)
MVCLLRCYSTCPFILLFSSRLPYVILGTPGVTVLPDGHHVSRTSDFIMYSVEAEFIDRVVAEYGPCELPQPNSIFHRLPPPPFFCARNFPFNSYSPFCYRLFLTCPIRLATKVGAIVAGQTSVKAPEKAAFEKYLPEDVHIVSCHSLHGPTVSPLDQPLVSKNLPLIS